MTTPRRTGAMPTLLVLAVGAALGLSACGQKGPLYLPAAQPDAKAAAPGVSSGHPDARDKQDKDPG